MRPKYITIKEDKNAALFIYFMIYTMTTGGNRKKKQKSEREKQKKFYFVKQYSVEFMVKSWKIANVVAISLESTHIFGLEYHTLILLF